jgi:hypothetical protein
LILASFWLNSLKTWLQGGEELVGLGVEDVFDHQGGGGVLGLGSGWWQEEVLAIPIR